MGEDFGGGQGLTKGCEAKGRRRRIGITIRTYYLETNILCLYRHFLWIFSTSP